MKAKTPKGMGLLESLLGGVPENLYEKPIPQIGYGTEVLVIEGFYAGAKGQVIGYDINGTPRSGYTLYYNIVTDDVLPISIEEKSIKTI